MAIRQSLGDCNCGFKSRLLHQNKTQGENKQMKKYIVPENRLKSLIANEITLRALEVGGVDNWSWYGQSIRDFLEEFSDDEDEDNWDILNRLAEQELQIFNLIKE